MTLAGFCSMYREHDDLWYIVRDDTWYGPPTNSGKWGVLFGGSNCKGFCYLGQCEDPVYGHIFPSMKSFREPNPCSLEGPDTHMEGFGPEFYTCNGVQDPIPSYLLTWTLSLSQHIPARCQPCRIIGTT